MKKEISPEMYNYNKYPGPSFARVGDKVVSENIELDLLEDYKNAFDQTIFGQRFSQLMLKFDYIVGDWGNEQLRLRGFYTDDKNVKSDLKISRLDDYLTEYCNFGCAYFVLANPNPQDLPAEEEDRPRRKRSRSRNRNRTQQRTEPIAPKENKSNRNDRQKKGKQQNKQSEQRHFTMKNAGVKASQTERSQKRESKQSKREMNEVKRNFVIRQK
ncbi:YutD-like domain-containing protein [Streptococcus suis]|uniref:YutD family protein n=1 Tax=Streptococcus suis TaxID=1307 RepID=UPI0029C4EFD9|nr:YutD-like domain-containing protein [Streptococcus suis]MDX5024210.1 YutD-like domain-containing protein [Streptococcus suis]